MTSRKELDCFVEENCLAFYLVHLSHLLVASRLFGDQRLRETAVEALVTLGYETSHVLVLPAEDKAHF